MFRSPDRGHGVGVEDSGIFGDEKSGMSLIGQEESSCRDLPVVHLWNGLQVQGSVQDSAVEGVNGYATVAVHPAQEGLSVRDAGLAPLHDENGLRQRNDGEYQIACRVVDEGLGPGAQPGIPFQIPDQGVRVQDVFNGHDSPRLADTIPPLENLLHTKDEGRGTPHR